MSKYSVQVFDGDFQYNSDYFEKDTRCKKYTKLSQNLENLLNNYYNNEDVIEEEIVSIMPVLNEENQIINNIIIAKEKETIDITFKIDGQDGEENYTFEKNIVDYLFKVGKVKLEENLYEIVDKVFSVEPYNSELIVILRKI